MAELKVKIPEKLEKEMGEFSDIDWSALIEEFIRVKAFELELERSRKLRHILFKSLISESKFSEKDALEIGRKINESMFDDLKSTGLL